MTRKKTASINIMVEPEIKKHLKEKAAALNLDLTGYIEKIAKEDLIFMDANVKKLASMFMLK